MTARLVATFVLLVCVGGLGLWATVNELAIVEAVNAKLPTDEQFNSLGWYLTKTLNLHRAYRRLYPDGRLLKRQAVLATLALLCLVIVATLLGFGFFAIGWFGGMGLLSLWLLYARDPTTR